MARSPLQPKTVRRLPRKVDIMRLSHCHVLALGVLVLAATGCCSMPCGGYGGYDCVDASGCGGGWGGGSMLSALGSRNCDPCCQPMDACCGVAGGNVLPAGGVSGGSCSSCGTMGAPVMQGNPYQGQIIQGDVIQGEMIDGGVIEGTPQTFGDPAYGAPVLSPTPMPQSSFKESPPVPGVTISPVPVPMGVAPAAPPTAVPGT